MSDPNNGIAYTTSGNIFELYYEKACLEDIPVVTEKLETAMDELGCLPKPVIQLSIAIDEIYSNIVKFAYDGETGPAWVRLDRTSEPEGVLMTFSDAGVPYNPLAQDDPDITQSAEERKIGGLGLFMVKKSMEGVYYDYDYTDGKNNLRILKFT